MVLNTLPKNVDDDDDNAVEIIVNILTNSDDGNDSIFGDPITDNFYIDEDMFDNFFTDDSFDLDNIEYQLDEVNLNIIEKLVEDLIINAIFEVKYQ
jgi:hypothetical protein